MADQANISTSLEMLEKIEVIFDQVSQCQPEQRSELITRLCAGDTELQNQVEMLVEANDIPDPLFDDPASVESLLAADFPRIGTQLGPYFLKKEIGRGGMGVVYLAEQKVPIHREIALKVIDGGSSSREVMARFETEKQSLAIFDHPNLTRIFDAGMTECGYLYFSMEYVPGEPITHYCDRRMLGIERRLEMMVDVCRAIGHAHQRGIIHRDIKPSNVIVSHSGNDETPKVIDFGIAKALSQSSGDMHSTQLGVLVGTPQYMSPEQAGLDNREVDTRSDIYSLGVLMYELLVGSAPIRIEGDEPNFLAMCKAIRESDFDSLHKRMKSLDESDVVFLNRGTTKSRMKRLLGSDLEAVLFKALSKHPDDRYSNVDSFRVDIQAILDNRPVSAVRPSTLYRMRKWVQRNRTMTSLFSVTITFLVVIGLIVKIFMSRESRERSKLTSFMVSSKQLHSNALKKAKAGEELRELVEGQQKNREIFRRVCRKIWFEFTKDEYLPADDIMNQFDFDFMVKSYAMQNGVLSIAPFGELKSPIDFLPIFEPDFQFEQMGMIMMPMEEDQFDFESGDFPFATNLKRAIDFCVAILDEQRKELGSHSWIVADTCDVITQIALEAGDLELAHEFSDQAVKARKNQINLSRRLFTNIIRIDLMKRLGKLESAEKLYRESDKILSRCRKIAHYNKLTKMLKRAAIK